jgi:hypothetical protein
MNPLDNISFLNDYTEIFSNMEKLNYQSKKIFTEFIIRKMGIKKIEKKIVDHNNKPYVLFQINLISLSREQISEIKNFLCTIVT